MLQSSCSAQAGTNPMSSSPSRSQGHSTGELVSLSLPAHFVPSYSIRLEASRCHQVPNTWTRSLRACAVSLTRCTTSPYLQLLHSKFGPRGRGQVEHICKPLIRRGLGLGKSCLQMASISNLVLTALAAFQRLESLIKVEVPSSAQSVRSNLSRFKIWAGSLGAHRPYGHRSLEYRLSGAAVIRNHVVALLQEFCGYLTDGRQFPAREMLLSQF